ncbi:MAG: hypothetical protein K9G49_00120 [Taibaiella sp.]|nr:hypothetical protein [Taibaiella sp.]
MTISLYFLFTTFTAMKLKHILSLLLICIFATGTTYAFATAKKKPKKHFKLITAYTKTITETEQTNPPMPGNFFVVRWEGAGYPETMFWRGDGGWLTCRIEKAHKVNTKGKPDYIVEELATDNIRKGDTLMLTPLTGGRFPIPTEIPEQAKNTLYYKVNGSKWLAFPVSKITKK